MNANKDKRKKKLLAGATAPGKFAAAEQAMASGGILAAPRSGAVPPEPALPPKAGPEDALNSRGKQAPTKPARTARKPASMSDLVVRDTFSMPEDEYALIEQVRNKAAREGQIYSKSEIVRAALLAFARMPDKTRMHQLETIEKLKPGRKT